MTLVDAPRRYRLTALSPLWGQAFPELPEQTVPEVVHVLTARCAIQRLAAGNGLDIVHDHTLAGPLNVAFCQTMGLPVVTTVHGCIDTGIADLYRMLGHQVNLVAVGDQQRQLLPDLDWVDLVPNAIDVADWPLQVEKEDYALFLGGFSPDNVPHMAVRAAHEAGVPIVVAGKCDGSTESACFRDRVLPMLNVDGSIFGRTDAASRMQLLARARCLLVPVDWEDPSATAMTEAMACGTPVVALNRGSVNEVVVDGVTGIICDHPDDLADAIRLSRQLDPLACRRHIAQNFNAETIAGRYVQIYRRILISSARGRSVIAAGTSHQTIDASVSGMSA